MKKSNHEIGMKINSLTLIGYSKNIGRKTAGIFRCDCGVEKVIAYHSVLGNKTISCGCKHKQIITKHGSAKRNKVSKLYKVWSAIIQRCLNTKSNNYKRYGANGVSVCEEWESFDNFNTWSIANGYKEGLEIDRIDGTKGYSPTNCRFVTKFQNNCNKKARSKSGYKGVVIVGKRFISRIKFQGKQITIGAFYSPIEAAIAYDRKAKEMFGEYAWLNSDHLEEVREAACRLDGVEVVEI